MILTMFMKSLQCRLQVGGKTCIGTTYARRWSSLFFLLQAPDLRVKSGLVKISDDVLGTPSPSQQ
jgi:hypothetical protein